MNATEIKKALSCGMAGCSCRTNGNTHCPVDWHRDSSPSLSVKPGAKQDIIVYCHGGCDQDAVIEALRERGLWLQVDSRNGQASWHLVKEWPYPNDGTSTVAIHGREERGSEKRMRWRLPRGEYKDGLGGMKLSSLPLYNRHLLAEQPNDRVLLVEGEKCADAATATGALAVSLPGGASQTDFGDALAVLRGRNVTLLPDGDDVGRKLMGRVARMLAPVAAEVRVLELYPGATDGNDVADWLADHDATELRDRAASAARQEPTTGSIRAQSIAEWLAAEDDAADVIVGDGGQGFVLSIDGKGAIAGPTGIGKSNLLLRFGRCVAEGCRFLNLPVPKPRRVLHIALEGSRRGMRKRLAKVWADATDAAKGRYALALVQLNIVDDTAALDALIRAHEPEVLVIDPLRNAHALDENDSRAMAELTGVLDGIIARHGCALVFAHHSRKANPLVRQDAGIDAVRGSTALTGWLSFCLNVRPVPRKPTVLVAEFVKVRDAEEALPVLELEFLRSTIDFKATTRAEEVDIEDLVLTAVYHAGSLKKRDILDIVKAQSSVGERRIAVAIGELEKAKRLLSEIRPDDKKAGAKTYSLPEEQKSLDDFEEVE